jgi:hypothetical protein
MPEKAFNRMAKPKAGGTRSSLVGDRHFLLYLSLVRWQLERSGGCLCVSLNRPVGATAKFE